MTNGQRNTLSKVEAKLQECRQLLDDIMYRSEPITDDEYNKVRACYDKICGAVDEL